jgi:hypothetical protein
VGLTIVGIAAAVAALPHRAGGGRLGPRRVGLIGTLLMAATFALFGTATGSMTNWVALWSLLAFASSGADDCVDQRGDSASRSRAGWRSRSRCRRIAGRGGVPPLAIAMIGEWGWRGPSSGSAPAGVRWWRWRCSVLRGAQDAAAPPGRHGRTRIRDGRRAAG